MERKRSVRAALAAAALLAAGLMLSGCAGQPLPVDPGEYVDVETGNYYAGVVEPQQTWEIRRDTGREVAEVYVKVGQAVTKGEKLFSYDTADSDMQLQQLRLEIDGAQGELDGYAAQIKELTALRDSAEDELVKLGYTEQINDLQSAQRQAQLSLQQKQTELENLRKSAVAADVVSTMDGVIKSINDSPYSDAPYMTVLAAGAYQVKATVDEMNVGLLSAGTAVTVRSRVDAEQTWQGVIRTIDTENTVPQQNDGYYFEGGSGDRATRYYFYVTLDSADGLLLGQHVFVEPQWDDAALFSQP